MYIADPNGNMFLKRPPCFYFPILLHDTNVRKHLALFGGHFYEIHIHPRFAISDRTSGENHFSSLRCKHRIQTKKIRVLSNFLSSYVHLLDRKLLNKRPFYIHNIQIQMSFVEVEFILYIHIIKIYIITRIWF